MNGTFDFDVRKLICLYLQMVSWGFITKSFLALVHSLYSLLLTLEFANEWIKKLWYIYTMEFYAEERKKELLPFATAWMELENIMLSEISQEVRDQ